MQLDRTLRHRRGRELRARLRQWRRSLLQLLSVNSFRCAWRCWRSGFDRGYLSGCESMRPSASLSPPRSQRRCELRMHPVRRPQRRWVRLQKERPVRVATVIAECERLRLVELHALWAALRSLLSMPLLALLLPLRLRLRLEPRCESACLLRSRFAPAIGRQM